MKIEVSIGEAIDKLSILELKLKKINNEEKKKEIVKEIKVLDECYAYIKKYEILYKLLIYVNESIWDMTDTIKSISITDSKFPLISNQIFEFNQKRFRIKNWFNILTISNIKEQKSYSLSNCNILIKDIEIFKQKIINIYLISLEYDSITIISNFNTQIKQLINIPIINYIEGLSDKEDKIDIIFDDYNIEQIKFIDYKIEYGLDDNKIDITYKVIANSFNKEFIEIPTNDEVRATLYGDPCWGVVKYIYISTTDGTHLKFSQDHNVELDFNGFLVTKILRPESLTVYKSPYDKIRLGKDYDGGYIICDIPDIKYDFFLSGGILDDISFEEDFCSKYPHVKCLAHDGFIDNIDIKNNNITFIKQYIGDSNNEYFTNLHSIINQYNNIFIKMDIEGGEIPWINSLSTEQIDKFAQIVIEFHFPFYEKECLVFEKLLTSHVLVHFHANNCCGTNIVKNIKIPNVFECTYIHKKYYNDKLILNTDNIPGTLDMKNVLDKDEIYIDYPPFVHDNKLSQLENKHRYPFVKGLLDNKYIIEDDYILKHIYIQNNTTFKIGFYDNGLSERGTTTALYSYADYAEKYFKCKSIIFYNRTHHSNNNEVIDRFRKRFIVYDIDNFDEINNIIVEKNIKYFYNICAGKQNSTTLVKNCKNLIHAVFNIEPFGDIYAGISAHIVKKSKYPDVSIVPHMIDLPIHNDNMRSELKLDNDAFVIGRIGGYEQFDVHEAHNAIIKFLNSLNDTNPIYDFISKINNSNNKNHTYKNETNRKVYFVFVNTAKFYEHPQIIYLDKIVDPYLKVKYINTCNCMIHARSDGETFGLAIAEFSSFNKPIITCRSDKDNCHLDILGEKAIIFDSTDSLITILENIQTISNSRDDWNTYKEYTPEKVMIQFKDVFLSNETIYYNLFNNNLKKII